MPGRGNKVGYVQTENIRVPALIAGNVAHMLKIERHILGNYRTGTNSIQTKKKKYTQK